MLPKWNSPVPEPVKLLQITDTHLFADPEARLKGVNPLSTLKAVIGQAAPQTSSCQRVLATGDLVHDGSAQGYEQLHRAFSALNVPVSYLPGNHDAPEIMQATLPGMEERSLVMGSWHILLLNTHRPGSEGGYLDDGELEFLGSSITSHPSHPTLVCLHHPPVPINSPWMDAIGLDNADAFLAIMHKQPQVKAVLFGHIHQAFDKKERGIRFLGSPSTCTQFKPNRLISTLDNKPPGYRWLHLYPDGRLKTGIQRLDDTQMAQG